MLDRLTIGQKLFALILLLQLVTLGVGSFGWLTQQNILSDFATTYNDRVVCLKQLKQAGDSYAVNIVDAAHKLRAGSMSDSDFLHGLDAAQATLKQQWGSYRATYLTDEEKGLADAAETAMHNADGQIRQLRQIVQGHDQTALQQFVGQEPLPCHRSHLQPHRCADRPASCVWRQKTLPNPNSTPASSPSCPCC
jgi:methyl-accepting chemotaxis protein